MRGPASDVRRLSGIRLQWLFLAALVVLGAGIGLRDPWPADEPRFVLIALEMIETGDWLIPHRGGEAYPDKPPIFMWVAAASIVATGSVRLGFLLPSLLAALGTLWLVVDMTRRLHGRRVAMLAGIALLVTVQFALQSKTAQIDMLVSFWITLGAYGIMRHALLGPARHWWLTGCAAMGLGVITKGVGFLPLLMIPVWVVLARRGRAHPLSAGELVGGLGILVAVIALWVVPMLVHTAVSGDSALLAYRDNILLRQTAERYVDPWHHHRPFYYFPLQVLPWAWLPWSLALPWALPNWWRRLRRGDARTLLPLSGVLLIIVFFSLSPAKRGVYMTPTAPLLILALAPLLPGLLDRPGFNRATAVTLFLLGSVLGLVGILGWVGVEPLAEQARQHEVSPWLWLTLLAGAMSVLLAWLKPRRGALALAAWLALLWSSYPLFVWPDLDGSRSPRDMMAEAAGITGPAAWLALHDFQEEFLLHARQPSVHFGYHTDNELEILKATDWLSEAPASRWLLISRRHEALLDCVDLGLAHDLGFQNGERWLLVPGRAFINCQGDFSAAPVFVAPTSLRASPFL